MTSTSCQPALGKSILATLMITGLLMVSGCSDKPQDNTAPSSSSESTQVNDAVDNTGDTAGAIDSQVTASQEATPDTTSQQTAQATTQPEEVSEPKDTTEGNDTDATNSSDAKSADSKPEEPLSANAGKELYEKTCKTCHENGLLGAPKYGDKVAWAPRVAKGKDVLYQHSINGYNAMPPKGAAVDASDAQIKAAVDYMVAASS